MKKKELKKALGLAAELNEQKDLKIEKLHSELLSLKTAPDIIEAVSEMDEITLLDKSDGFAEALESELKKEVVEAPTNFSSRFMPNVKFINNYYPLFDISLAGYHYCYVSEDGLSIKGFTGSRSVAKDKYDNADMKEVSICEALPGLVPVDDNEAFEAALSKVSRFKKDDVFKVTEVEALCDSCKAKDSCSLLSTIKSSHDIYECSEYQKKLVTPTAEDVKLGKLLTELQLLLWGTELPVLIGVEFSAKDDEKDVCLTNYTISFTTADNTKES